MDTLGLIVSAAAGVAGGLWCGARRRCGRQRAFDSGLAGAVGGLLGAQVVARNIGVSQLGPGAPLIDAGNFAAEGCGAMAGGVVAAWLLTLLIRAVAGP